MGTSHVTQKCYMSLKPIYYSTWPLLVTLGVDNAVGISLGALQILFSLIEINYNLNCLHNRKTGPTNRCIILIKNPIEVEYISI